MSLRREPVNASDAPEAIGPYVHAIRSGDLLFCSGQIPIDPRSGELVDGSVGDETGRCLENLAAVCAASGATLGDAVRLTVYTTEMESFAAINDVYELFFEADPPARVTVGVAALPRGARVEIDAVVAIPD